MPRSVALAPVWDAEAAKRFVHVIYAREAPVAKEPPKALSKARSNALAKALPEAPPKAPTRAPPRASPAAEPDLLELRRAARALGDVAALLEDGSARGD